MSNLPVRIALLILVLAALPGCSLFGKKTPKSSAHLVRGDSSTIHFSDRPETAGGEINTY